MWVMVLRGYSDTRILLYNGKILPKANDWHGT